MSGYACAFLILGELVGTESFEPLIGRSALLAYFFLLALFLLKLFEFFLLDLVCTFLQKNFLRFILPDGFLSLSTVFQANTQVGKDVISQFIAKLEECARALISLGFNSVTEFREHIH